MPAGFILTIAIVLLSGLTPPGQLYAQEAHPDGLNVRWLGSATTLRDRGGRVDWSPDGSQIVYDSEGEDGYFDIRLMDADGSKDSCLTCDRPEVSPYHNGNPAWHPGGEYIVFQGQDPKLKGLPLVGIYYTNPGSGINNDVWLVDRNGSKFWRLTELGKGAAVLHPHFSHDGKRLIWAQRVSRQSTRLGQWAIQMADFAVEEDGPRLENVRELRPGNMQFYETHGFSPDDRHILFTASPGDDFFDSDIYLFDLEREHITRLTGPEPGQWDEHAHFLPDGRHIVWMSSRDIRQRKGTPVPLTDYWIMTADGENKERLTFFNDDRRSPYHDKTAADWSPSPDGKRLACYLINRPKEARRKGAGMLVLLEIDGRQP